MADSKARLISVTLPQVGATVAQKITVKDGNPLNLATIAQDWVNQHRIVKCGWCPGIKIMTIGNDAVFYIARTVPDPRMCDVQHTLYVCANCHSTKTAAIAKVSKSPLFVYSDVERKRIQDNLDEWLRVKGRIPLRVT